MRQWIQVRSYNLLIEGSLSCFQWCIRLILILCKLVLKGWFTKGQTASCQQISHLRYNTQMPYGLHVLSKAYDGWNIEILKKQYYSSLCEVECLEAHQNNMILMPLHKFLLAQYYSNQSFDLLHDHKHRISKCLGIIWNSKLFIHQMFWNCKIGMTYNSQYTLKNGRKRCYWF